ncbi:SH3 domain-containing protein [Peribacillus asahii]|uniref:SH3 domain-containing protein n=1 Tax=Peribacillus asahii TaxID=228899 RepID=UPI003820C117
MKRLFKVLIMLALVLSVFSFNSSTTEAASTKTAFVNIKSGTLNVRSGAGTKYKKVGSLKKGAKVAIYSNTKNGWSEIRYKKKKAYVATKYLKFSSSEKNWTGKYSHLYSGNHVGATLTVKNQTKDSYEFIISEYGEKKSNGEWVYYTIDLKGKAKIKNGVGYYNENGCQIVFDYTNSDAIYHKGAIYTDVSGSCKAGKSYSEGRNLSKDKKLGYVKY